MNELINNQITEITEEQKTFLGNEKLGKKIPLQIVWTISQTMVAKLVKMLADQAQDLAGAEKKKLALEAIKTFYDTVFLVFSIPFVPSFLEPIIHSKVKYILMLLVSVTIDATVKTFRDTGVIN